MKKIEELYQLSKKSDCYFTNDDLAVNVNSTYLLESLLSFIKRLKVVKFKEMLNRRRPNSQQNGNNFQCVRPKLKISENEIIKYFQAGYSLSQLEDKLKVSKSTIFRVVDSLKKPFINYALIFLTFKFF